MNSSRKIDMLYMLKVVLRTAACFFIPLVILLIMTGCDQDRPYQKNITSAYDLKGEMANCSVNRVNGTNEPVLTVVVCPGASTTSTQYEVPHGKTHEEYNVIVIDKKEYNLVPKKEQE